MGMTGQRSAVVVPIRLPATVETIRRRHVDNATLGVPAHVTLLFPFIPPPSIDEPTMKRLAASIVRAPRFAVAFDRIETFEPGPTEDGVAWLAPEPPVPFVSMTAALVEAFPGYLPYEGAHDEVIPHLTLAEGIGDVAAIRATARRWLPFRRTVAAAVLLVEDAAGRWRVAARMPLG